MTLRSRYATLVLVVGLVLGTGLVIATGFWWQHERHTPAAQSMPAPVHDVAPIRLARPDALIVSSALRDLPRDLLQVPALKTLLTEQFVFYYQQDSHLLGIAGTVRRIAYEHHLTLRDDVIALLLDRPADVGLWRGRDGRLSHWMIDTSGSGWIPWLRLAAKLAGKDAAIDQIATLRLPGNRTEPVYQLDYGRGEPLYFTGRNGHLVVFSDRAMIDGEDFGDAPGRARFWDALLTHERKDSPLRSHFGLVSFTGKHTVLASAKSVSFGYQYLAPSIEALRFDFDGQRWVSYLRLAAHGVRAFNANTLWQAVPDTPGLCVSAPIDWQRLRPALTQLAKQNAAIDPNLVKALEPAAAVCWLARSSIYTPLVLARVRQSERWQPTLSAVFTDSVGNSWPRYAKSGTGGAPAASSSSAIAGADQAWQKTIATDYGSYRMTLAQAGGWLVFSPDAGAVNRTLATIHHRRPALAARLPVDAGTVLAVIAPAALSQLFQHAIEGDLPAQQQPLLRSVATERLLPRLKALTNYPPYALVLASKRDNLRRSWEPVTWTGLHAAH